MKFFKTKYGSYYLGDARELIKQISDESIDIIITDPPYGLSKDDYDDPDVLFEIEDELYRVLKPDAFLLMFYSIQNVPIVFKKLKRFEYTWIMPIFLLNYHFKTWVRVGINTYYLLLVFRKGRPKPKIMDSDVILVHDHLPVMTKDMIKRLLRGKVSRQFKGENAIAALLRRFTDENETILDPFAGYGSIPFTCEIFRRKWIAFEIDPQKYEFAKQLLSRITEIKEYQTNAISEKPLFPVEIIIK